MATKGRGGAKREGVASLSRRGGAGEQRIACRFMARVVRYPSQVEPTSEGARMPDAPC